MLYYFLQWFFNQPDVAGNYSYSARDLEHRIPYSQRNKDNYRQKRLMFEYLRPVLKRVAVIKVNPRKKHKKLYCKDSNS